MKDAGGRGQSLTRQGIGEAAAQLYVRFDTAVDGLGI